MKKWKSEKWNDLSKESIDKNLYELYREKTTMAGCASDLPWMKDACSEERVKIFEDGNTTIQRVRNDNYYLD